MARNTEIQTVLLTPKTKAALVRLAALEEVSQAALIRTLIRKAAKSKGVTCD